MAYKLIVTEHADELLDHIMYYLLYRFKNEQAARHLLDGIENIYGRIEENPLQFPLSRDEYLASKDYHEAIVPQMDYIVVFLYENGCSICGWYISSVRKLPWKTVGMDLQEQDRRDNVKTLCASSKGICLCCKYQIRYPVCKEVAVNGVRKKYLYVKKRKRVFTRETGRKSECHKTDDIKLGVRRNIAKSGTTNTSIWCVR